MVKIAGSSAHTERLKSGLVRGKILVNQALFASANRIQKDAQISITTGAVSGKNHVPSAPGEAPNNDTAYLANNIEAVQGERISHDEVAPNLPTKAPPPNKSEPTPDLIATVSSNGVYSAALEFGASRMAARPFMGPALQRNKDRVAKDIAEAINRANAKGR